MSRCDSAAIVPNTSELLPEPETPVKTVSRRFGSSTSTSLRLCSRAPCTRIRSWAVCGVIDGRGHGTGYPPRSPVAREMVCPAVGCEFLVLFERSRITLLDIGPLPAGGLGLRPDSLRRRRGGRLGDRSYAAFSVSPARNRAPVGAGRSAEESGFSHAGSGVARRGRVRGSGDTRHASGEFGYSSRRRVSPTGKKHSRVKDRQICLSSILASPVWGRESCSNGVRSESEFEFETHPVGVRRLRRGSDMRP